MDDGNNIKAFSAADIERYHNGSMPAVEMHALEKAAMDDPFLADALDGYQVAGVNASADLADLQNRLKKRTEDNAKVIAMATKPRRFYWMRVAAMIVVVAGAGVLAFNLLGKKKEELSNASFKAEDKKVQTDTLTAPGSLSTLSGDSLTGTSASILTDSGKYFLNTETNNKTVTVDNAADREVTVVGNNVSNAYRDTSATVAAETYANTTRDVAKDAAPVLQRKNEAPTAAPTTATNTDNFYKSKQLNEVVVTEKTQPGKAKEESLEFKKNNSRGFVDFGAVNMNSRAGRVGYDSNSYYNNLNVFRGRVVDASNNPISFANVNIPEVNVGTYADAKGNFTLVAPDSVLNVNLRAVGFNSSQTQLKNIPRGNEIVLQEDKSVEAIVMSNSKPNASRSRSATMVLTEPEPDDGWEKYDSYLVNNIKVPEKDNIPLQEKESGRSFVEVSFDVNKDGEPINIKVTKSLCKECDAEAIRLVKEGPKWKKKNKKGKATVTVAF